MITKNQTKKICELHDKKGRQKEGYFLAEGKKLLSEILKSELDCIEIYALENWIARNESDIKKGIPLIEVSEAELKKISTLTTPQEVLAVVRIPENHLEIELLHQNISLVLDGIKDPGNLGTIIRIADWYGIKDIICSPDTVDAYNPKVVQGSMGSISRVRIHEEELLPFFTKNKQEWHIHVYAATMAGESIYQLKPATNGLILLGNESRGINEGLLQFIESPVHIPAYTNSDENTEKAESLNVAIAAALICAEFRRPLS